MDALTIAMEDAFLDSDKEVMEVEDQGSKVATVADPAPVPAPATIPDPVSAPTPSPTPTLVSESASELLALKVASVEKSSGSTDPDLAAAPTPAKASNVESSSSNVCKQCRGRHPLYRCASFRKLPHENRLRFVILHRHCYICLSPLRHSFNLSPTLKCDITP
ncbi:dihydrolipoyllysine-residue acetyltransferase component of pyruvate dehydrogenase complex-like [Lucilia cuprina]|uniref:dihydrolipoyllysine-residue acetyltransferase component of pyruvate dehydrogenase complex-like n=1 Tax=Lucilia cuprina TaxID=7375 RepID=UPI001F0566FF|nr:dihydrolipoyllysine-residue acetyltransferase component of pyruvate dehydrogenase complex-like [Lucilia cuprina]